MRDGPKILQSRCQRAYHFEMDLGQAVAILLLVRFPVLDE